MSRARRKIEIVVESLTEQGIKEFQGQVNRVYADMIRTKLIQTDTDMKNKIQLINGLISEYEE